MDNIDNKKLEDVSFLTAKILLDHFQLWDFVLKVYALNAANSYLESGLPLPVLDFATFTNTKVGFNGQFIRLCTDLSVNFENILS